MKWGGRYEDIDSFGGVREVKGEDKTKEQLIAKSEHGKGSEFIFALPVEYQRGKHKGVKRGE